MRRAFYERHIGEEREVLFEAQEHGASGSSALLRDDPPDGGGKTSDPVGTSEMMLGFTDNYIRASAPYDAELVNTPVKVTLDRFDPDGHIATDVVAFALVNPESAERSSGADHLII